MGDWEKTKNGFWVLRDLRREEWGARDWGCPRSIRNQILEYCFAISRAAASSLCMAGCMY